ncbi:MAG: ShlB/FhaC/HecB family hemolysin secretion/activation protein [Rhodocyclaceae bacterium]
MIKAQPGKQARMVRRLVGIVGLAVAQAASGQAVPDAGSALRETVPPPAPPATAPAPRLPTPPAPAPRSAQGEAAFVLKSVVFSGNRVFSGDELAAFAADKIGKSVTFADLDAIAARIGEHYRRQGYFLAQAILPAQDVTAGKVEFSIIEGTLGQVRINRAPDAPIAEDHVQRFLAALKPGEPLTATVLEQAMMALSDLPGIVVQSSLEAGLEPGTADLEVDVTPRRRWEFAIDADNHGSRANGEFRVGATGRINSPFGLGDNLDVRVLSSSGGGLRFGRLGYELPVGFAGTRLGIAYSRVEYHLGKEFAPLGANGEADVYELALTHPFVRSRTRNVIGKASLVEKVLADKIDLVSSRTEKRVRSLNLGLAYEARDGWLGGGYTSASATATLGSLDIRTAADLLVDQTVGHRTDGRFGRLNYQVSRLQALAPQSSLFMGVSGQLASANLDSAEKIALGGPSAVRAYAVSEANVDQGFVATLEYRYSPTNQVTVSGFYDAAWGSASRNPLPREDNRRELRGYGVGLFWAGPERITVRGSLAWRETGRSTSEPPDRVPRLFVQLQKPF